MKEEDKLHQFLMGLDETLFGAVKSSLLSCDPLPTVDEAYQVVTQDEESKCATRSMEERNDAVSFAMQSSARPRAQADLRDPSATCTLCGRTGHLAANCFRKIGYPTWWGDRPRSKLPSTSDLSKAPVASRTPATTSRRTDTARVNHISAAAPATAATMALNDDDRVGFTGLNDQQWRTLVHMLNERNPVSHDRFSGTFFSESWIIDSGASNHMTGTLDCLSDVTTIPPIRINLPDGRVTTPNRQGKVGLGTHLQLRNVFFVDGLQCHLISVSQLTHENRSIVTLQENSKDTEGKNRRNFVRITLFRRHTDETSPRK